MNRENSDLINVMMSKNDWNYILFKRKRPCLLSQLKGIDFDSTRRYSTLLCVMGKCVYSVCKMCVVCAYVICALMYLIYVCMYV